jgi:hypothetical protein
MQCKNRAAVFSMRSVPTTIGKLFILYRPMVNSVAGQCNNRAGVFSLWSDHRLYKRLLSKVTKTNDRPDLASEGAPDIDKTVTVTQ